MMSEFIDTLKKYNFVGIRTLRNNESYKIGDKCRCSYDWDFENDCSTYDTDNPIELDGTSCIDVCISDYDLDDWGEANLIEELYSTVYNYGTGQKALIAGYHASQGNDNAEIIITGAVVIHIKHNSAPA